MEVGNELCVLVQAYISMTILYAEDADQNYAINYTLTAVIRAQLMVNFILIVRSMVRDCKSEQKGRMMKRYAMSWKTLNDKEKNPRKYAKLTDEEVE